MKLCIFVFPLFLDHEISCSLSSRLIQLEMSESEMSESDNTKELRSLALTPTWSVATVLTIFVVVSLLVERSIHRLSNVSNNLDVCALLLSSSSLSCLHIHVTSWVSSSIEYYR